MYRSRHRFQVAERKEEVVPERALMSAVILNRPDEVISLVNAGADVNTRIFGSTPLGSAIHYGPVELVSLLLRMGADVNMGDDFNVTPLHSACIVGNPEKAKILLNAGANVNAVDIMNRTPLFLAVKSQNKKLVKILLKAGANPFIKNYEGMLPIDLARVGGGIYKLLRRAMLRPQIEPLLTASARGEIFDPRLYDKGLYRLMSKYM